MLSDFIIRSAAAVGGAPFRLVKCTALGSAGAGAASGTDMDEPMQLYAAYADGSGGIGLRFRSRWYARHGDTTNRSQRPLRPLYEDVYEAV